MATAPMARTVPPMITAPGIVAIVPSTPTVTQEKVCIPGPNVA